MECFQRLFRECEQVLFFREKSPKLNEDGVIFWFSFHRIC